MPKKVQADRPLLILPYKDTADLGTLADERSLSLPNRKLAAPSLRDWALFIGQNPRLAESYMRGHTRPEGLRDSILSMREYMLPIGKEADDNTALTPELIDALKSYLGGIVDLTTLSEKTVRGLFKLTGENHANLHFITKNTGRIRLELHKERTGSEEGARSWQFSSVNFLSNPGSEDLRQILTEREVVDTLQKGASILVVTGQALPTVANTLYVSMGKSSRGLMPEFSVRHPGQSASVSRAVALELPNSRERIRVEDLADRIVADAVKGHNKGRMPTVFLDLDGTLFNARKYTVGLFREWLETYDGPLAGEIRERLSAKEKADGEISGWNGKTILLDLGITDAEALSSALAYHNKHFFDPEKRVEHIPVIEGTVEFVKLIRRKLQARGIPFRTVYVSLRSDRDDILPNGKSSAEMALRACGLWDQNSERLFWDGPVIDWSHGAGNEPKKHTMVKSYLEKNTNVWGIGYFDNTPNHLNGYKELLGGFVPRIHVQGDHPPGSEELEDGTFTLDPDWLSKEISSDPDHMMVEVSNTPASLATPAFAELLPRIFEAKKDGKTPIVLMDLDDTAVLTAPRTKTVLKDFLREWAVTHPDLSWTIDLAAEMRPSRVEYSTRDVLRDAGLLDLGLEEPFTKYFLQHFLSNEHLADDPVREGAIEFLHDLKSLGVKIVYLTGRTRHDMGEGTMASLSMNGFPILAPHAELIMREDTTESDESFKGRMLNKIAGSEGSIVAMFDNEPGNLNHVMRQYPGALLYLVGNRHSPNAPKAPLHSIHIDDFSGRITQAREEKKPSQAELLGRQGRTLAANILQVATD